MSTELASRSGSARGAVPVALAAAMVLAPVRATAGEATTTLFADAIGRYGPNGIMFIAGAARRWLQDDGPSPLTRGRYAQLGVSFGVNPAYAQGSVAAEWVPVAPLQLGLRYDAFGFFGVNGALLRLPSPDAKFGDDEIDALRGTEETGIGHRVGFRPTLRVRIGPVLAMNQTDLDWYQLSRSSGWYYEWEHDTLLAEDDWLVANRTALMVEAWRGAGEATLLLGPVYDFTRAVASGVVRQRLGVSAYWSPAARWLGFDRPRVYAHAGVNLVDRNREGEPFAVLGFGGDLDVGDRR